MQLGEVIRFLQDYVELVNHPKAESGSKNPAPRSCAPLKLGSVKWNAATAYNRAHRPAPHVERLQSSFCQQCIGIGPGDIASQSARLHLATQHFYTNSCVLPAKRCNGETLAGE
jgi:hypothetical protein